MIKMAIRSAACLAILSLGYFLPARPTSVQPPATTSGYKLDKKVKLGGSGGWDYLEVDPATHRLFISRATHVIVVDPDQGKILGDIPNSQGVHGIAIADEFNKGFITNGKAGDATMFDLTSLEVTGHIKTDKDSDAIIYDPFSKRVFTFNGDANTATAIDASSGKVFATFPLGGGPELPPVMPREIFS
jgi:DNA-binding beta-propeller fold protein YncE